MVREYLNIVLILSCALLLGQIQSCGNYDRSDQVLRMYKNSRKLGIHKLPGFKIDMRVETDFNYIIRSFEEIYGGNIGEVSVVFGDSKTFAHCRVSWKGTKKIIVSRDKWDAIKRQPRANEKLKILIFHELGHCVLERFNHIDDRVKYSYVKNGIQKNLNLPASIMISILDMADLDAILMYKDQYYLELFSFHPIDPSDLPINQN